MVSNDSDARLALGVGSDARLALGVGSDAQFVEHVGLIRVVAKEREYILKKFRLELLKFWRADRKIVRVGLALRLAQSCDREAD
jgi:hypothetical protein